jgi:hypothetical protein
MEFYRKTKTDEGFEAGIESALSAILVSPEFLFRIEHDPAELASGRTAKPLTRPADTLSPSDGERAGVRGQSGTVYRISDVALASRLSFFIWSSIPDDGLLETAERGELHRPEVLENQVRRMLAPNNGCISATWRLSHPTCGSFPTLTTICARHFGAKPRCTSKP